METKYLRAAVKVINGMDRHTKQKIKAGIENLPKGDVRPLRGSRCSFRLRVGDWRILFAYLEEDTILIEKIGPYSGYRENTMQWFQLESSL